MKVIRFILFITLISFIFGSNCITQIPNKRSDCHNAEALPLNYCCYFKGIDKYAKVEKCTNVLKSKIDGDTNGIPNVDIYISNANSEILGDRIDYLDCKSSYYQIGLYSLILFLILV